MLPQERETAIIETDQRICNKNATNDGRLPFCCILHAINKQFADNVKEWCRYLAFLHIAKGDFPMIFYKKKAEHCAVPGRLQSKEMCCNDSSK